MRGHVRELTELYEELLLDHAIRPRNRRRMEEATAQAEGNNPLCGDRCTVYLLTGNGIIQDISFDGSGCAILLASASLMTLAVNGKRVVDALAVAEAPARAATMTRTIPARPASPADRAIPSAAAAPFADCVRAISPS